MRLKSNYKTAIHEPRYGWGRKYRLFIGVNPYGKRGGTCGLAVDSAHEVYFRYNKTHAENMKLLLDKILETMKICNIQEVDFDYYRYHIEFQRIKPEEKTIKDVLLREFLKYREARYGLLIVVNRCKL